MENCAKLDGYIIVVGSPCSCRSNEHGTMECNRRHASIDIRETLATFAKLERNMIVWGLWLVAIVVGKVSLVA